MNFRHGDLALIQIDKLPGGLTASKSKVLMQGSGGNDHSFDQGTFYEKQDGQFVIGYLDAPNGTTLFHPEHGEIVKGKNLREASIPAGVYECRKQFEETHSGMTPVID